ncbi:MULTISPECIES: LysE family transporter [unclassified Modicisalibacter]|uniref:LysE/ArgO family amino acid transporter n=1 Tax=unclassified Modicisalibacter TaxID=2679913 RepID=UPI001CC9BD4C|nr:MULTISPECIES: LysE family transporter [unclassified Modicisalibacter]MBZ9559992.1 LysE family transporter [Modicisalibacter sp. R2A 31.J]MBZ9575901.1 LysE family transporter [Modicisalibacter sp. MOD 31.J]
MLSSAIQGLGTGAALIVAIGAQNAFVLGQGLRRRSPWLVAAICSGCDVLLIALGGLGLGPLIAGQATLMQLARWGGAAFLLWQAGHAWRRALVPSALTAEATPATRQRVVAATLAVTLLNPQVYLDTVVMLGAIGAVQASPMGFYLGAMVASLLWFFALVAAAGWLAPRLAHPGVWRVIDGLIGTVLIVVAGHLLGG